MLRGAGCFVSQWSARATPITMARSGSYRQTNDSAMILSNIATSLIMGD